MDIKEIQELIKFVAKSGVSEVELESKGFKMTIKTPPYKRGAQPQPEVQIVQAPVAGQVVQPIIAAPVTAALAPVAAPAAKEEEIGNHDEVKSPMIGTFYRSSSPDKPAFASVGDDIKKGDVLCIIEAMKLFNEIEAEISGKIIKVLVDDSTPVEYDQPLFLIEPA
jgi:acetyl-CoA carboxylase biotin carboxyl carrier protein